MTAHVESALLARVTRLGLRMALALVTCCVVASSPARAGTASADSVSAYNRRISEQERQLKSLRSEIHDLRKRDRELGQREVGTQKQLRLLEREAALQADLLRSLRGKQQRVDSQLEGIRAEHGRATEELEERKRRLARTLRIMYVRGTPRAAEVLLRTTSLREALSHFKYLGLVARNNEHLLEEIREQEAYLAHTDAMLTETLFEIRSTATEAEEEKKQLAESQQARTTALERVRQQRAEYQRALQDLAESEKRVQGMIGLLEKRRQEAIAAGREAQVFPDIGFARLRGSMPWPVRGRLVGRFGTQRNPRHGTVTFNSGIEIAAAEGEPVRCVARGQVEYVSWLDGYGKTIIVNHGGGYYTIYAHLSQTLVIASQTVEPGQVIGHVGDTGSLDGVKLHFEVRAKADAVDPRLWLSR